MPNDFLLTGMFPFVPFIVIKIMIVSLLLLHIALSIILVRQTKVMIAVVEAGINSIIYLVSIIHLSFSAFVLIWTIIFL